MDRRRVRHVFRIDARLDAGRITGGLLGDGLLTPERTGVFRNFVTGGWSSVVGLHEFTP